MRVQAKFRLRIAFAVVCSCLLLFSGTVSADTYNINASVPYAPPSQASTITTPAQGAVFQDVQQLIQGTCQVRNPALIVSIWRDSTVLGSAECVGGTYSVPVVLSIGHNKLVAKTANINGLYGPDSEVRTVLVERPVEATPLKPGVNQPTNSHDSIVATNQGGLVGLSLTTEAPFTIITRQNTATIRVVVSGGQQPYVMQLKWGDGSTEAHTLSKTGNYEFTHTYLIRNNYSVYVYLRDVLGSYTEYVYAVASGLQTISQTAQGTEKGKSTAWRLAGLDWYWWTFVSLLVLFLYVTYLLGYRRGKRGAMKTVSARRRTAKKKRK